MKNVGKMIEKIIPWFITVLFTLFVSFIFLQSIFGNAVMSSTEHVYFVKDNVWMNLLIIIAVIALLYFLKKKNLIKTPSNKFLAVVTAIYATAMIIFIVVLQVAPVVDQYEVLSAAKDLLKGNFERWSRGEYCDQYPNQNGLILFLSGLSYFLGEYNWMAVEILNIPMLIISAVFTSKIVWLLFKNKKLAKYTYICILLFFPANCLVTFVYGTTFGMAFVTAGIYLVMKSCLSESFGNGLVGMILVAFSCVLKENYAIFFIAVLLVLLYHAIVKKQVKSLGVIAYGIAISLLMTVLVNSLIPVTAETDDSKGIPTSAWVAMGMQEGRKAPGWWNGYNNAVYKNNGYNTEKAKKQVNKDIGDRLKEFSKDGMYTANFFSKKISSLWNETTYQGLSITYTYRRNTVEWASWVKSLIYDGGFLNTIVLWLCDKGMTLMWLGVIFFVIFDKKGRNVYNLLFAIIFLGGFIFHLFWEARSLYVMNYVYLMIPYMIRGYQVFIKHLQTVLKDIKNKKINILVKDKRNLSVCILIAMVFIISILNVKVINQTIKLSGDEDAYAQYITEYVKSSDK